MGIFNVLNSHLIEKIIFYCCDLDELHKNKLVSKLFAAVIN